MSIVERAQRKLDAGQDLSTGEAAALLSVDKTTVIRMAERGEIPARRKVGVGRYWLIDAAAVRALVTGEAGQDPST